MIESGGGGGGGEAAAPGGAPQLLRCLLCPLPVPPSRIHVKLDLPGPLPSEPSIASHRVARVATRRQSPLTAASGLVAPHSPLRQPAAAVCRPHRAPRLVCAPAATGSRTPKPCNCLRNPTFKHCSRSVASRAPACHRRCPAAAAACSDAPPLPCLPTHRQQAAAAWRPPSRTWPPRRSRRWRA